jgi:glycosyltransferase involved in cell wall biosynthesis/SAM-dependent methyltransferase
MIRYQFPEDNDQSLWTGERFVVGRSGEIEFEHYGRYLFATQFCADKEVLDIACGEGYGSYVLAQAAKSVVGVDIDRPTVDRASRLYSSDRLTFAPGSCTAIPAADAAFDVVVTFETIEHIAEHDAFLAEVRRVLRPGGLIIISTPDRDVYSPPGKEPNPFHVFEFTLKEFDEKLSAFFSHVSIGIQKSTSGSMILPLDETTYSLQFFRRLNHREFSIESSVASAPYLIAIASDRDLPSFKWGVLDDPAYLFDLQTRIMQGESEKNAKLAALLQEIGRVNTEFGILDAEKSRLVDAVVDRDRELERLNSEIIKRDRELERLNSEIIKRDQELERLNSEIIKRDQELERLNSEIIKRDNEIHSRNVSFVQLEQELNRVKAEFVLRCQEILDLNGALTSRDQEIANTKTQLQLSIAEAHALGSRIDAILRSTSWRMTRPVRGIRRLLAGDKTILAALVRRDPSRILPALTVQPEAAAVPQVFDAPVQSDSNDIASTEVTLPASSPAARPVIVFATHDCSRTGAPMLVLNMLKCLAAIGQIDAIVVSKGGGYLAEDMAALAPLIMLDNDGTARAPVRRLDELLSNMDGRRVLAAFCNTIATADLVPVFRRHQIPVLSLVHELPTSVRFYGINTIRTIDEEANAVVFGSSLMRDRIVSAFACRNPNIHVIPTGYPQVSRSATFTADCRRRLRDEASCGADAIIVVGCGTIDPRKGVDLFLQVARIVAEQAAGADVHFAWVGGENGDPYSIWLRHDVETLGLGNKVHFLGAKPDVTPYLAGADIFLLPSREDPFPLVALAALASGVPVIAYSGAGGAEEILAEGAGIIVPYANATAMAQATIDLITEPTRRRSIGQRGASKFDEQYTINIFLKRLWSIVHTDLGVDLPSVEPVAFGAAEA